MRISTGVSSDGHRLPPVRATVVIAAVAEDPFTSDVNVESDRRDGPKSGDPVVLVTVPVPVSGDPHCGRIGLGGDDVWCRGSAGGGRGGGHGPSVHGAVLVIN